MDSSGLQEMLELIYTPNAVIHIQNGKSIVQAIHEHFIVDAALNILILRRVLNAPLLCQTETPESNDADIAETDNSQYLDEVYTFFEKLMSGNICAEGYSSNVLEKIKDSLKESTESVKRTSVLWVHYMSTIDILRTFIRVECTGNWELHLHPSHMAASGHNSYTKSGMLYLQQMSKLPTQHPYVQQHFNKGLHVIRRSNRLWAGLPSDLVIEQFLMKSLKTSRGVTRGHGMTEN